MVQLSHIFFEVPSASDPRVHPFRSLRGIPQLPSSDGLIIVEGRQQVERVLSSSRRIHTLFLETQYLQEFSALLSSRSDLTDIVLLTATRQVMEQIVGYRLHQGAMALIDRPQNAPLASLSPPIVALDRLVDPENVGSIVRSAVAFGVRSILSDEETCDPLLRRAIRVSMGAALEATCCRVPSLAAALAELRDHVPIIALENHDNAVSIWNFPFTRQSVLVLGNERLGIAPEILALSEAIVSIPTVLPQLSSLNVAAAAAIAFAQLTRTIGRPMRRRRPDDTNELRSKRSSRTRSTPLEE